MVSCRCAAIRPLSNGRFADALGRSDFDEWRSSMNGG
jgi:hypothetical protein